MLPSDETTIIAAKILLDARDAIKGLKSFSDAVQDPRQRVRALRDIVQEVARQLGGDFDAAEKAVRKFAGSFTGIKSDELRQATLEARVLNKELERLAANQAKTKSLQGKEFSKVEQAGDILSFQLREKQAAADAKILAEKQKQIDLENRELALIEQQGAALSRKLQAQQRISDAKQQEAAASPQVAIPQFVNSNFGDINRYIDQSANKVEAWKDVVQRSATSAGVSFERAGTELKKMVSGTSVKDLNQALRDLGGTGQAQFGKLLTGINALKIAMGALVSMVLFQLVQAFSSMVAEAVKGLKEIESAMFNIQNAEQKLSEQGVEISIEGLEKLIVDLKELNPMLSKFQATELVSVLASKVAPALNLTGTEIESLAKSVTVLAVRNQALGKSFEEVQQQVVTGLLSGKVTAGINQLGLKITDQIVKEEALATGLIKSADAYDALNAKEQERINALAIISILEKNTAQEAGRLPEFLKTASGQIGIAKAQFSDLLTGIGQTAAPLIKSVLRVIISVLEDLNAWLEKNKEGITRLLAVWGKGFEVLAPIVIGFFKILLIQAQLAIGAMTIAGNLLNKLAEKFPAVKKILDTLVGALNLTDTPTGSAPNISGQYEKEAEEVKEAAKKLQDIMKENEEKLADIERDYKRKIEDINRDAADKRADIIRDAANKRTEAEIDYAEKIEDINRDANNALAEAQEDYRKKERDREAEFQQKLKELREKFLFDLEDALRERDARQVLRLIRQYNADKQNLIERNKLEKAENANNLKEKLAEIEIERQQKLAAARREYEEKIREIAIGEKRALQEAGRWHRRQLEDARLWYQRQLADQREFLKRKLEDLRASYSAQLQMANSFMNSLNGLMTTGTGGSLSLTSAAAGAGTQAPGIGSGTYNPYDIRSILQRMGVPGYAEGGTVIANKPTLAMFGERGPEAASFTPLNRTGANVGKVFGDTSGLAPQGRVSVEIDLSPDLEGRIINQALNETADVVLRVNRSKL